MNRRERRKKRIALARAKQNSPQVEAASSPAPDTAAPSASDNSETAIPGVEKTGATGPCTPEGKAVSSRNAVKHNLCSTRLTGPDLEELNALRAAFEDEWEPQTQTERILLEQMALSQWRMNRALALELEALDQSPLNAASLALVLRYRTTAERNFYKALAELQRLRTSMRRDAEREARDHEQQVRRELDRLILAPFAPAHKFVSQDRDDAANSPGFVSQNRPAPPGTAMPFSQNQALDGPACRIS